MNGRRAERGVNVAMMGTMLCFFSVSRYFIMLICQELKLRSFTPMATRPYLESLNQRLSLEKREDKPPEASPPRPVMVTLSCVIESCSREIYRSFTSASELPSMNESPHAVRRGA